LAYAKRVLLEALAARQIGTVLIEYDGECDSGQIGNIDARDAHDRPVALDAPVTIALREGQEAVTYCTLHEALDDFAWTLLQQYHDGFENDGGGFGTIAIDVPTGSVALDHNDRFMNVLNTETEV
jgi:hypothetical protein